MLSTLTEVKNNYDNRNQIYICNCSYQNYGTNNHRNLINWVHSTPVNVHKKLTKLTQAAKICLPCVLISSSNFLLLYDYY